MTEHHVKSRIVALFDWGVEQGLISTNPVKGIRKPQLKSRGSQAVIDDGELERLMSAAPAYLRNVLIALQQSGARPCEVLTVEAKNFVDNLWILDKHKTSRITGKPRIIYLTPALVELCKELVVTIRLFRGTVRTPGFSGSFLFAVRAYSFFSDAALVPHPNATLFRPSGSAMASVTIDTDLPPGGTLPAYQRHGDGHGFEVSWPWPARCRCDSCRKEDDAHLEVKDSVQVVRDLDIWGQPSFWINPTAFHRCPWCHHRQHLLPPFKRKDTSYTSRFEQQVLRLLIGSNEEEVVRRLALAAETVGLIVKNQLADAKAKQVDPQRVITDVSIDELSLKQRHKLDVTILTDLTNPDWPVVLAVAAGRDEAAGRQCLEKLSEEQRLQVQAYRADMGQPFHAACRTLLKNAHAAVDRFHVAKKCNETIDGQRKKIPRSYKQQLSKAERKEFRSLRWEFRRNPKDLTEAAKAKLEGLFAKLPLLRRL